MKDLLRLFLNFSLFLQFVIILLTTNFLWIGLEVVFDGGRQASMSDTIIGLFLTFIILDNIHKTVVLKQIQDSVAVIKSTEDALNESRDN